MHHPYSQQYNNDVLEHDKQMNYNIEENKPIWFILYWYMKAQGASKVNK